MTTHIDGHNQPPLVTVVTICYNHERFIRDCLDGIVSQQTDFAFDVIVVDDASTDSTPRIISEYAAAYPHIFRPILLKENRFSQGKSHFTDTIIPNIHSKYVAICEGDDYWTYPGKLQRQVEFLESHPGYSGCFHHFTIKDETQEEQHQVMFNLRHSRRLTAFDIFIEPQQQTATTVMRSGILLHDRELHSYFNSSHFSDVALFLAMLNAGKVYCFREWWSIYRIHSRGLSYAPAEMQTERHLKILQRLGELYGGKFRGLDKEWMLNRRMREHLTAFTIARRHGRWTDAMCCLARAIAVSPLHFCKVCKSRLS